MAAPNPGAEALTSTSLDPVWLDKTLSLPRLEAAIEALTKESAAIPSEVQENSLEGQKRTEIKQRIELLSQLRETLLARQKLAQATEEKKATSESALDEKLRQLEKLPAPELPAQPNLEKFATIQAKFDTLLKNAERLEAERDSHRQRLQRIPEAILEEKARQQKAVEEIRKVNMLLGRSDGTEKIVLEMRAGNALLTQRLTEDRIALLGMQEAFEKSDSTRMEKALELAQQLLGREEQTFKLYQEALNAKQDQTLQAKADTLIQKEAQAKQAETDLERFFSQWEVHVASTQKNIADWQQLQTLAASRTAEQEKKLKTEKSEFENLVSLVKRLGAQGMAAELLKSTFRLIGQRRRDLDRSFSSELREKLEVARIRSMEVEAILSNVKEVWRAELDVALAIEPDPGKRLPLEQKAQQLLNNYKNSLRDEENTLFEVNVEQRRLELLAMERAKVLEGLEGFVLSKVFWIQDADPIGFGLVHGVLKEMGFREHSNSVIHWLERLFSKESVQGITNALGRPLMALYGMGLLVALIAVALLTRLWLRQSVEVLHTASAEAKQIDAWATPLLAALADAAFWPINLLIAAWALGLSGLPEGVGAVLARLFMHWALFLFLWRLNSRFFSAGGLVGLLFGMPEDLAKSLLLYFRAILVAYPVLLMPWIIFHGAPFHFEALPRVGYTAYEATVAIVVYLLLRSSSPLIRHAFGGTGTTNETARGQGVFGKHWGVFSSLIFFYLTTVVALDVMGYRFGAAYLTRNGLLSIVTLFVLIGAHRLFTSFATRLIHVRQQRLDSAPPGEFSQEPRSLLVMRLRKFIRLLFILLGALIFSSYWGINEQTFDALNNYAVFSSSQADGRIEMISAADMIRFLLTLVLTIWLVRNLSGVLELTLFQQLHLDQGLRYAILTISRYIVVIIGLPWALSWLHVDLGKIAWLAAAISVGIGFGLQEIVANFISGIILLVERPVRVGDRITVGITRGEVRRINIRATTVINREQQEIIIPNRDLITKEVVNWTLSHNHVRLKIPVGVAYGSDVEKVRKLLLEVAQQEPLVLTDPPPRAYLMLHGASSLDFELRVFYSNPDNLGMLTDRLNTAVNKTFSENGVVIPFPQQDVHIRSGLVAQPT